MDLDLLGDAISIPIILPVNLPWQYPGLLDRYERYAKLLRQDGPLDESATLDPDNRVEVYLCDSDFVLNDFQTALIQLLEERRVRCQREDVDEAVPFLFVVIISLRVGLDVRSEHSLPHPVVIGLFHAAEVLEGIGRLHLRMIVRLYFLLRFLIW